MERTSRADARRTQILEAFTICAEREGIHNASIRKIADQAGVRPGLIHYYFMDRDELIRELVVSTAESHIQNFKMHVSGARTPRNRFRRAADFLFGPELMGAHNGSLFYDLWSEAKRNEVVRNSLVMVYSLFRQTILDLLEDTGRLANMSAEQAHDLACVIIALYEGIYLQWDFDRDHVDLARLKATAVDMIDAYFLQSASRPRHTQHLQEIR